jgi:hypothetical protein
VEEVSDPALQLIRANFNSAFACPLIPESLRFFVIATS